MGRKSHKYGKNKRKIHTGGKSILHIRTSGAGYTKTAKRGRLGKNCVYFDLEKKTCELRDAWCNNSSQCCSYKRRKSGQSACVERN